MLKGFFFTSSFAIIFFFLRGVYTYVVYAKDLIVYYHILGMRKDSYVMLFLVYLDDDDGLLSESLLERINILVFGKD